MRWPSEVGEDQVLGALMSLNGYSTPRRVDSIVLVGVGRGGLVTHLVGLPPSRADGMRRQLEAAILGLAVEPVDKPPTLRVDRAWTCRMATRERPLDTTYPGAVARSLLTALGSATSDELLVARWVLGPVHRPTSARRRQAPPIREELWAALRGDLEPKARTVDPAERRDLDLKQAAAGWHSHLHLGVLAEGRRRQRQLLGLLAGAVRVAQGPDSRIRFWRARPASLSRTGLPATRPLLVNVHELCGLAGWPIGPTDELPIARIRGRLLPPPRLALSQAGRVVAMTTYPGGERPLVLSARDALHHLHIVGPTGTGKSTLMLNLITQDIAAGRSVVVVDPRGDLVAAVLDRVPDDRLDDVVVVDPRDPWAVGLNPLAVEGLPADLRADHILHVFKRLWRDSWGPRTQDILTSGLLTLAATPGTSLVALPLLFTDRAFRAPLVARARDPLGLDTFWAWFDNLSDGERAAVLAPTMNKLRAFLLRERLRRIVGQAEPRFDLRDIYRTRKILLVSLASGDLGPESATLLGSLVVSHLWQTLLGRAALPVDDRHPVMVFIDEFQEYLHLPTDVGDVLAQARGLGVGLTVAHQHLAQLDPDIQAAVLANARSRVVFGTAHDDAHVLFRNEPRLTPADVAALGRYEAYVSVLADNQPTPYASSQTVPPSPPLGTGDEALRRSRGQWAVPSAALDADLAALVAAARDQDHDGPGTQNIQRPGRRRRRQDRPDEQP